MGTLPRRMRAEHANPSPKWVPSLAAQPISANTGELLVSVAEKAKLNSKLNADETIATDLQAITYVTLHVR